jgi:hypothetical protein
MKHYEFEISLFVDGELPEMGKKELFTHLSECMECRDTLSEYLLLKEKGASFCAVKMETLKKNGQAKNRFYKYILYTSAAAAILILALNINLKPHYITKTEIKYDTVFVSQRIEADNNVKMKPVLTSNKKRILKEIKASKMIYNIKNMASVKITDADLIKRSGDL